MTCFSSDSELVGCYESGEEEEAVGKGVGKREGKGEENGAGKGEGMGMGEGMGTEKGAGEGEELEERAMKTIEKMN